MTAATIPTKTDLQTLMQMIKAAGQSTKWFIQQLESADLKFTVIRSADEGIPDQIKWDDNAFTWDVYNFVLNALNELNPKDGFEIFDELVALAKECNLVKDWVFDFLAGAGAKFDPECFVAIDDTTFDAIEISPEAAQACRDKLAEVRKGLDAIQDRRDMRKAMNEPQNEPQSQPDDHPRWDDETLANIGLSRLQCVPTMVYQAILRFGRERGMPEEHTAAHHGPVADGRDLMGMDVLADLLECVIEKTKDFIPTHQNANEERSEGDTLTQSPSDLPSEAPTCEDEGCILPATWLIGSGKNTTYRCDEHEKSEELKKLKRRVNLQARSAEQTEAATQKEKEDQQLVNKYNDMHVTNAFTGEVRTLGAVVYRLLQKRNEIEARERTAKAEIKALEAEYTSLKACYGGSILEILDQHLPRKADGGFHKKYLPIGNLCRLSGKKTGGITSPGAAALQDFVDSLDNDELEFFGVGTKRTWDLEILKDLYQSKVETNKGRTIPLVSEPDNDLGDFDVGVPA